MKNDFFNNVVIGVLLGDASIQRNSSKTEEKWRLKFSQQIKHQSYIEHLHLVFKDYVKAKPFYDDKRKMVSFQSLFDSRLNQFTEHFLPYLHETMTYKLSFAV